MSTDSHQMTEQLKQILRITKGLGDKAMEATAYENLGTAFHNLGDFTKAVEYHSLALNLAKDLGNEAGEGRAYGKVVKGARMAHLALF